MMKSLTVAILAFAGLADANAIVCARGPYRGGCAGPHGAVVGHRGYYHAPYYRRGVVVHRRYY